MIPPTLFVFVSAMLSLGVVESAIFQRDGAFTSLSTSLYQGTSTPSATTSAGTQTYGSTSSLSLVSTTSSTSSTYGVPSSMATVTSPPVTSKTQKTPVLVSTSENTTQPYSSTSAVPTTTPCEACSAGASASSSPVTQNTTQPCNSTSSVQTVTPCQICSATVTSSSQVSTTAVQTITPCHACAATVATSTPVNTTQPCSSTTSVQTITPCHACSATVTTTSPVTTSTGTANCDGVQQWQASFAYTTGNRVIFNNQLFTAKQWTYDNSPPAHPDQWSADGTCTVPINNQANCNGVSAWQSTVAYNAGSNVTFNDHLWSAVQWTESNSPGDTSGTWQDEGACA